VKAGVRALGVAESFRDDRSTLAGAVVRADRVTDDFVFESCTVGGTDATETVCSLFETLDREDVQYVLVSGIALAWYNILDLQTLHETVDRPVLSVTYEESPGLEPALREAFEADALADRLETYRARPVRRPVTLTDETVYVRQVGIEAEGARDVVDGFTAEGGRPEPLRVARLAARAADRFRRTDEYSGE